MSDIVGAISSQTGAICGQLSSLQCAVAAEGAATRRALDHGFEQVTHELRKGFDRLDRRLEDGFSQVNQQLESGFSQLDQRLSEGFDRTVEELAGLRLAHGELIAIASTPAHTAAMEHFRAARDAYVRGLLPEALEELERATSGVAGVSAGYKTDWRFYVLRGLIHLGVGGRRDDLHVNPVLAFHDFELALRYVEPGDTTRRSVFLTCGGRAKAMLEADAEDEVAIGMFVEAIRLDDSNVEARLELGRVAARRGRSAEGLPHVQRACVLELRAYRVVERDLALACYRPELARQKSEEILRLQSALVGLSQQLVASVGLVEQQLGVAWNTSRLRPQDDERVRRMQRSRSLQNMMGCLLIFGSMGFFVVLSQLRVAKDVPGPLLLVLLVALVIGIALSVEANGRGKALMLTRAAQAAVVRLADRTKQSFGIACERIVQAVVVARAWTDCVTKLFVLGVAQVDELHQGHAACLRLDQLAKGAGV